MNWNNEYFDESNVIRSNFLLKHPHSPIIVKTKAAYARCENTDLIKRDSLPVPISTPIHYYTIKDPIESFKNVKLDYEHKKTRLEARLVSLYKLNKISKEKDICRKDIKDYITMKYLDPTPYVNFDDGFCYYPHHGTLKSINTQKFSYLAHTIDCDTMRIEKISSKMPLSKYNSYFNGKVHATELMVDENLEYAAIRGRNQVKIAELKDIDNIKESQNIKTCHTFEHKNEIFASSLNYSSMVTIDSEYVLRKFNLEHEIEALKCDLTENFYLKSDKLLPLSIRGLANDKMRDTCSSITTRNSFGIIDYRNKNKISLEHDFSSNNLTLNCEKIFNHIHSLMSNDLVYIATSHMLYAYDFRKLKEPVVCWTHQLYEPPMMISTVRHGRDEVICVSSHMIGDLKVFNHFDNAVNFFPYRPHSITNTYNRLREQGLFLLSDNIKDRVNGSVAGISLHSDPIHSTVKLYTQNSFGDVFETNLICHDMKHEHVDLSKAIEHFQLWENILQVPLNPNKELTPKERIRNGDLIIDDIARFENLPKYLNDKNINEIIDIDGMEAENYSTRPPLWKVNIEEAKQCNDLLAKEIMYLWEDVDDNYVEEEQQLKHGGADKVSMWLNNNQSFEVQEIENSKTLNDDFTPAVTSTQQTPARRKSRLVGF